MRMCPPCESRYFSSTAQHMSTQQTRVFTTGDLLQQQKIIPGDNTTYEYIQFTVFVNSAVRNFSYQWLIADKKLAVLNGALIAFQVWQMESVESDFVIVYILNSTRQEEWSLKVLRSRQ